MKGMWLKLLKSTSEQQEAGPINSSETSLINFIFISFRECYWERSVTEEIEFSIN